MTCARFSRKARPTTTSPRRCAVWLLLAWCLASGAAWDLVQVGAWARMWWGYAQSQSAGAALVATLSPDALCRVCEVVQDAKQGEAATDVPLPSLTDKVLLLPVSSTSWVVQPVPAKAGWIGNTAAWRPCGRAAPPVPPPKAGLGLV